MKLSWHSVTNRDNVTNHVSDWLLKIPHLEIELTSPSPKSKSGILQLLSFINVFLFSFSEAAITDYYTIKTSYTSKMLCLSLASQLPSHFIIPSWRPHEENLGFRQGTGLFPACELDPTMSQGYSYSGHWANLGTLLKPGQKEKW